MENEADNDSTDEPIDWLKWTTLSANVCQVVMVVLVAVGYYTTVLPIIQKEQIAEQMAKLQEDQKTWENQLVEREARLKKANEEILVQESRQSLLEQRVQELTLQKETIANQLAGNVQVSRNVSAALAIAKAEQTSIETSMVEAKIAELKGETPLPLNLIELYDRQIDAINQNTVGGKGPGIAKNYPNPLKVALLMLEQARNQEAASPMQDNVQRRFVAILERNLNVRESWLVCPEPDYDAWEVALKGAMELRPKYEKKNIEKCANAMWADRQKQEGWTNQKTESLKSQPFWKEQTSEYQASCVNTTPSEFLLKHYFESKWKHAIEPCVDRLKKLNDILAGDQKLAELKPFRSLDAPSLDQVRLEVFEQSNTQRSR